jgi:hypothetical protein
LGRKLTGILVSIVMALVLIVTLSTAASAAKEPMSATGTITYISGTAGFPSGSSGNYMVMSRTVTGSFFSGDLGGEYSMTYKGNIDLNTQSGHITGNLTVGPYRFDIDGTSYPVAWTPSPDSPVGYIGSSSAGGIWKWQDGGGSGSFSCIFSFMPTADGHIDYILPGSTFTMSGQWNIK